jgi:ATP-dependent DNA helicase RecG
MLEEKRPKSWLKSVSAFANGAGGSLFFGINDDGTIRGLDDVQHTTEAISAKVRDYMDPIPEVEMIPHEADGVHVLQLKVKAGHYTPYYYVGDGGRIAFTRIGDESLPATAEQMMRLVLKGSNKTFDSLRTEYKLEDYPFASLANAFRTRTYQEWIPDERRRPVHGLLPPVAITPLLHPLGRERQGRRHQRCGVYRQRTSPTP